MTKSSPKKVLIAIDFAEQSLIALAQGINLAKVIGAEVTLLHVIEDGGILGKNLKNTEYEKVRKEVDLLLQEQITAILAKHGDLSIAPLVARGRVYEKTLEIAEMLDVEFIVMGCKGMAGGLRRKFIGSNALQVVRASRWPVLTIKGGQHNEGCRNIVLPLDLTKETREKVGRAIEFARLYNSAVRVLSVIFTKDEFIVNRLTRQLSQVKTYLEKAGIECSAEIVKGIKGEENLAQCIVDYSSKVDGDLLLIMTQQEVDFTEFFIGSSAQEIIVRAEMPVLSIIPGSDKNRVPPKPKKV